MQQLKTELLSTNVSLKNQKKIVLKFFYFFWLLEKKLSINMWLNFLAAVPETTQYLGAVGNSD